jgi:glycosyltransferase involved in cell wall biosynthesis
LTSKQKILLNRVRAAVPARLKDNIHRLLLWMAIMWTNPVFWSGRYYCYARRGRTLRILKVPSHVRAPPCLTVWSIEFFESIGASGKLDLIEAAVFNESGIVGPWKPQRWLLAVAKWLPQICMRAFFVFQISLTSDLEAEDALTAERFFDDVMARLRKCPELVDFVAIAHPHRLSSYANVPPPFGDPENLPPYTVSAEPRRRSAIFLHHSYYHFNTLAQALRKRGWHALTVSVESRDSPQRQFYFDEDVNLHDDDPAVKRRIIREFFRTVPERFEALHFYGRGYATFFPENVGHGTHRTKVPWDFIELRRHRVMIGYMPSGCYDGGRQTSIRHASGNVCSHCVWELRPDICSDAINGAWADTLDAVCDWVGIEGDFAVDERAGPKHVRGPVVAAVDPDYWSPDLIIDESKRVAKKEGEILIFHAFGNSALRRAGGKDIKGSGAIESAVEKLRTEGVPLKLFFARDVPITEVRHYKAQADIVVDQLNYGRIGANAREAFMMGKPVVTRLVPEQPSRLPALPMILEAPALDADENSIESVLRNLASDPDRRKKMAHESRQFALRWFAADECARRYEVIIDRLQRSLPPETPEIYPSSCDDPMLVGSI